MADTDISHMMLSVTITTGCTDNNCESSSQFTCVISYTVQLAPMYSLFKSVFEKWQVVVTCSLAFTP